MKDLLLCRKHTAHIEQYFIWDLLLMVRMRFTQEMNRGKLQRMGTYITLGGLEHLCTGISTEQHHIHVFIGNQSKFLHVTPAQRLSGQFMLCISGEFKEKYVLCHEILYNWKRLKPVLFIHQIKISFTSNEITTFVWLYIFKQMDKNVVWCSTSIISFTW